MSVEATSFPANVEASGPGGPFRNRDQMSTAELLHHRASVSDAEHRILLRGEADFSVLADLRAVLDAVDVHAGQQVCIDAADLDFIDLACLQALVAFADRAQGAGASVRVEHANRLFRLLHGHADAGALRLA